MTNIQNRAKKIGQMSSIVKTKTELTGVVFILVIPLITALMNTFQTYSATNVWTWTMMLNCVSWVVLPAVISWLKGKYSIQYNEMAESYQNQIESLKDENQAISIDKKLLEKELEWNKAGYVLDETPA